jgi:parallel beta-helix repeat protein
VLACTKVHVSGSVQAFVDKLGPGDVGCVAPGAHTGNVSIRYGGLPGAPVTLTSAVPWAATVRGRVSVSEAANYVTVSNLVVDGSASSENTVQVYGDFVTLRGNDISNRRSSQSCLFLGHPTYGVAHNTLVDRNRLHDCGADGDRYHGIYAKSTRNARITNNLIYDNEAFGVQLYPDAQGTVFEHNIVDGNGFATGVCCGGRDGLLFGGDSDEHSNGNRVAYNIFSGNARYGVTDSWSGSAGTGNVAEFNCFWGNGRDSLGGGSGYTRGANTVADPLYVDRLGKDFRLTAGSPCAAMGPR